ncbi:DNA-3-methyladenine glycosylase [uncultured Microscilla sp.]|uniref:DNA-3-methyladenine glycosylase n=1 Tax=uncultured Microscilla sp. TaxID=432653 RepID=UPI002613C990|nr:DNA-3-methyladenine glycosylase [uncultured Microscilla sp.]
MTKLSLDFYLTTDVVQAARNLLGKVLYTCVDGQVSAGIIVETEAYCGATDQACHAYPNKRTKRTETMYQTGGTAYVYLCYGMHHMFNVVTNAPDVADAVLVRAIEPVEGLDLMKTRRKLKKPGTHLTAGPAMLTQALGISTSDDMTDLLGDKIWLEDQGRVYSEEEVIASPRVGIDYAGDDALLPWRFRVKENKWCSKAK